MSNQLRDLGFPMCTGRDLRARRAAAQAPAPVIAGVDVLAVGGGVVEAESVGDDGGGAWAASSRSAEIRPVHMGNPRSRSWLDMGGVGEGLRGVVAGEQPGAVVGLPGRLAGAGARRRAGDGGGRLAEAQGEPGLPLRRCAVGERLQFPWSRRGRRRGRGKPVEASASTWRRRCPPGPRGRASGVRSLDLPG